MLTKNFYNQMMATISGKKIYSGLVIPDGTVQDAARGSGPVSKMFDSMYDLAIGDVPTSTSFTGVRIGTGVTPATIDDHTLESVITSGMSVANQQTVSVTQENGFVAAYATYSVTNTGKMPVAISEIGLFCKGWFDSSAGQEVVILVDRTVLESPITINPGEAKPITYTIRFNYPTA